MKQLLHPKTMTEEIRKLVDDFGNTGDHTALEKHKQDHPEQWELVEGEDIGEGNLKTARELADTFLKDGTHQDDGRLYRIK